MTTGLLERWWYVVYEWDIDEDLIRRSIINFIKNAAEACCDTPSKIEVRLEDIGKYFSIVIQDNGPGISEDVQKNIFEAYFTTKHTGPVRGMGLGLAICQKIIIDHNGAITMTSKPGETIFTIRLPKKWGAWNERWLWGFSKK